MAGLTRRRLVLGAAGLMAVQGLPALAALRPATPAQMAGPFYPVELPPDDDNDLVHVNGQPQPAQGQVTELGGRILDRNGHPLEGLRVEIWQCDAHGRYHHPRDGRDRAIDAGFQGFGHTRSDAQGRYRFLTIRPVPYPGRTPHIHFAVFAPGHEPFVTQLYVAGEPRNANDFLYQQLAAEARPLVTAAFEPGAAAGAALQARWDIVLGITPA